MRYLKILAGIALGCLVSGCAGNYEASRSASINQLDGSAFQVALPAYEVEEINVIVPEGLIVSEANSYLPSGDIVWRGDPPGNRYEQVAAIFQDSFVRGTAELEGDIPVVLDVEVQRFHALTEKTRYSFGGVHSIRFELSIRSAQTGMLLEEPREVQADLEGYGGAQAIAADAEGQTQKVRISDHLAKVIGTELTDPNGFQNPRLGFVQMLNNGV